MCRNYFCSTEICTKVVSYYYGIEIISTEISIRIITIIRKLIIIMVQKLLVQTQYPYCHYTVEIISMEKSIGVDPLFRKEVRQRAGR